MLSLGKLSELAELSEVENAIEDPMMEGQQELYYMLFLLIRSSLS